MNKRWITAASTFGAATIVFGAAALAQTPSPGTTTTPAATMTVGGTRTAVVTGTVVVTGTRIAGTPVSGTPVPTVAVPTTLYVPGGTGNFPFAHPAFQSVWERTDRLLNEGRVKRSYFWGPGPNTPGLLEAYAEAPGGAGQRLVQYFDKSRMEVNNPQGNRNDPFFVTNGLLTVELISGRIQTGNNTFRNFHPACIPMSGDFGDALAPTYQGFARVSSVESGNNPSTDRRGQRVMETIDRNGVTGTDASKGNDPKVQITAFFTETRHNVPVVFMDFLNQVGPVYTNGQVGEARLIDPLVFVTGYPISEPFWARATIRGQVRDVLIQAFQRRALTYVPTNEAAFQVEMANIGQHYFDWRYRNAGLCPGDLPGQPTAPVPIGTITVVIVSPTAVQTATATATRCANCPTPSPTATTIIPPGTVVQAAITTPTATRTSTRTPTRTTNQSP